MYAFIIYGIFDWNISKNCLVAQYSLQYRPTSRLTGDYCYNYSIAITCDFNYYDYKKLDANDYDNNELIRIVNMIMWRGLYINT